MHQSVFERRRKEFMTKMKGGVAIFPSAPVRNRNGDVDYDYRQDSDFFYLTGFEEPESFCVLLPGNAKYEYLLFVRNRDKEKEIWNGLRSGVEGAIEKFRADMAFTVDRLEEILPEFLQNAPVLYFPLHRYPEADQRVFGILDVVRQKHRAGIYPPSEIVDPGLILSDMRLIKKPEEMESFSRAVEISAKAHVEAMKAVAPGMYEYEIQAVIEYVFRSNGALRNGYSSIVGSGPNSCILHYTHNNRLMQDGDMLLVDAGAEFDYYSGDITRTYPVNGKFTPEQKAVYEAVLHAQMTAIAASRPGVSFMQVHEVALHTLIEGLIELRLLSGSVEENIENQKYQKYFMHRTGHWLGIDVHDVGKYKQENSWRILEPGMVMTVEPGLYVSGDDEHEAFRNIGVRIEDDVMITEGEPRILSASCPKRITELEEILGSRSRILQ
jgi:Xaa-Pro aminopeptidase